MIITLLIILFFMYLIYRVVKAYMIYKHYKQEHDNFIDNMYNEDYLDKIEPDDD